MIAALSVLLVVIVSMIVIRVAIVALIHTGMGREEARFQARSAFTGAGFTTSESESIVNHPLRRRIVSWLMIAGKLGMVTATASLLITFIGLSEGDTGWASLGLLIAGLIALLMLSSSAWVDRHMCRAISWALTRLTQLDAQDDARLPHVRQDYGVSKLRIQSGEWLAGKTLAEAGLAKEGAFVFATGEFAARRTAQAQGGRVSEDAG